MSAAFNSPYEYQVGGSLPINAPSYVTRQSDSDLYNGLKVGKFCYVLNSRQMGKSSLRVRTMQRLQAEGIACAAIDITAIGTSNITPEQWYAGVIDSIVSSLELYKAFDLAQWWLLHTQLSNVNRFSKFIAAVLLKLIPQNIVIFIDEIDSVLSLNFNIDDFFAVIRDCYNKRADQSDYRRLTFALIGVATPSDLIQDKRRAPFNIGRAIELTGFALEDTHPLTVGLAIKASNPQVVMQVVLDWTGGQPFLTQKVCQLILSAESPILEGSEAEEIEQLVRSQIIEHWESQDEPEHFRTIRDRILYSSQHKDQLLQLYQQILQTGEVTATNQPEHMELRLTGLVVKQQGKLKVYNRIYASVFDHYWVETALAQAGLLKVTEKPTNSEAEVQALDKAASDSLAQFESQEIEALISAMQAGQQLKALVEDSCLLQNYPTIIPLYALQLILDNIRERNRWIVHQRGVISINFSPGGRYLATAGTDGTVRLWDLYKLQIARRLGHQGTVYSLSFSPDGKRIATAGTGTTIQVWDLSGSQLEQWKSDQFGVTSVSFSLDGQCLITAGGDGTVKIWDLYLSGQQLAQWKAHQDRIRSLSISPDGKYIATAGEDGIARLWDWFGQELAQLTGHQGTIRSLSFSPDGRYIVTAGKDGTARLWDLFGQELARLTGHHNGVRSARFSSDGKQIATAGDDTTVRFWNLKGQELFQLKGHQLGVTSISFSPDEQHLATAGWDDTVHLWDLSEKQLAQWHGDEGVVWSLSFSLDGQCIATAGNDGTVKLWDLSDQLLTQWQAYHGWFTRMSFSPDGQCLATAGNDGIARLWNLSGQQLAAWNTYQGRIVDVDFSPDGQCLALVGENCTARLWSLSGQQLVQFYGHQWYIRTSFSPNGQRIVTAGGEGTVQLWNLLGEHLAQFDTHQNPIRSIKFSPDGQLIAIAGGLSTAQLWNLNGWQLAQWNTGQEKVLAITFSPDGQRLATAGWDGTVRLWDLSGRLIAQWKGHQGEITSIGFSPDGHCLATTGEDGMVRLWRIEGLDELLLRGCEWLKDYLVTHPKALEKLEVCQTRFKSIEAGRNLARVGDEESAITKQEGITSSTTSLSAAPVIFDNLSSEFGIDYT